MIVVTLTSEQLSKMMQDAVRQGISEHLNRQSSIVEGNKWLSVEELSKYLPGQPAITTIYGKVQRREIPYKRIGKRLAFLKTEIDEWLMCQSCKTQTMIDATAEKYISTRGRRR